MCLVCLFVGDRERGREREMRDCFPARFGKAILSLLLSSTGHAKDQSVFGRGCIFR